MKRSAKFMRNYWRSVGLCSASLWAFVPSWVAAGPVGGHIVGGSGDITHPSANLTEIHQGSDRLAIDWRQFDVNANEVVRFIQPSSRSIALNRILDSKQSLILGRIEANGRLFLINPRGIIFGKDATVNVAGLVASALDIDPHNFMKGDFIFTDKGGEGVIVNQGTIEASVGGAVVLLGKVVINAGDIHAPHGSARLVSAGGAVISFDDNNQLGIQISAEQAQKIANQTDAVRNSGSISAEGGYIALTGATTADLFTNAVNNEGVLVASSVRSHNGVIELTGNGRVAQSGDVDVSATAKNNNIDGGTIAISGNDIYHTGKLFADGQNGGDIQLHAQDLILAKNNASISATGSAGSGGHIELLADRVGVMDQSRIDASGAAGGGVVHLGGTFHGAGPRNAKRTVVDDGVSIYADATKKGNGGDVVLWSDDITYFGGNIFARGGIDGGNGGNVEVSGKQSLGFTGHVDTSAPHGKMGNLLLDPAIINIINGSGGADDAQIADGIINASDNAGGTYQISEQALEALTSNVTLTATQQINIADLADNLLLFSPGGGTVTFNVTATSGTAAFTMADANDEIRVNNGNLAINVTNTANNNSGAADVTLGKLTTTTAGNISITTNSTCTYPGLGSCTAGAVSFSSGAISAAGSISLQGDSKLNSTASGGTATTNGVTMSLGTISAGTSVTVNATTSGTGGAGGANIGAVSVTTGDITAGGNVSVTGSATGSNNSGVLASNVGNVDVTTGGINTSGAVSVTTSSTASTTSINTANPGTGTVNVTGAIIAAGAVTLSSTSNGTQGIGTPAGDATTVSAKDISVTSNALVHLTASSPDNTSLETVNIGGNYIQNGGSYTIDTYTLNLTNNTVIDTTGTISLNYTVLNQGGFTLTQGAINNIWVGDISGSAVAGDLGFSQANITAFAGSGLVLSALNNIYLGNAIIDSPSATSITLTADSDHSGVGDISIAAGKTFNLNGKNLIAGGVNATINGSITNSGTGTQQFTTTGAITMGAGSSLTSGSGNIAFNAATGITMASDASISSTSGQLALTAANNIALGSLSTGNATTSAVNVTSTAGAISNAGAATNISASAAGSRVSLNAISGISAALSIADLILTNSTSGSVSLTNNRALQIDSFTNTAATAASITTTGAGSNMTVAGNLASGSNVALTSSGAFSINDGFTINPTAGTLSINSAGDAAITGLTTTDNTANAISVISGGAIIDNGNTNADITATGASAVVTLQAASGVGAANALDLAIANLALTNSTSGAVALTNNRALQINSLTNTPATATTITTTGATSDLTVAGATTSGGTLSLTSGRNMSIAGNVSGVGLTLQSSGAFAVSAGNTINSNAGTLAINSTGNAAITGLTSANNTASAISVISGGAISDAGADNLADITTTGASSVVTLQAASGIGSANAIDLNLAGQITASNTASGDIGLHALTSFIFGNITNSFATGAVALSSDGNLTANNITTNNGAITLGAFDNVTMNAGSALQSHGGAVAITADTNANNVGAITMNTGTINSGAGTITLSAAQDIALNQLTTTNATTSAVSITSTLGKILGNVDGSPDITATSAGARVTLNAHTGIDGGGVNPLELSVLDLIATNSTSGSIHVTNNRTLQISGLTNTPATATTITTTGAGSNMTVAGNVLSGSNIALTSSGTFGVSDGFTVNSNVGTLSINATGDAAITGLTTTNNTASAISVISGGAISDNGDTNFDISAMQPNAVVTLQAANGAGAANALDLAITNLSLSNSTAGAVNLTDNHALQVNSFANNAASNVAISITGAGNDLIFANTLQNNGGNVTLAATQNIDLQSVANVAVLSTNSATVNYTQSASAGSISSNGVAAVAADLTATAGNIDLQTVALGAGTHTLSTIGGDINLGAVTGTSDLQLRSGRNITLTSAALGAGNFSASSATNGTFTASGTLNASAVILNQFSAVNLLRIIAGNALAITANTINLGDNLQSGAAMTLTGTTQLQNDVALATTGSGNLLQLAGSVNGNGHVLTIAGGNNTVCIACTANASASGLAALDIQSSIKTVLGATSVNGNATINANQEIYLNDDTTVTGNLALLADANNDGVGIAALLTGKKLSVGGATTVQPIALSSIATPAQCASPTGLPQMPAPPSPVVPPPQPSQQQSVPITNRDVQIAIEESDKYGLAVYNATLHNVPQIAYLNNSCSSDSGTHKNRKECDVDASMLDFLGTFLIDNQVPNGGDSQ